MSTRSGAPALALFPPLGYSPRMSSRRHLRIPRPAWVFLLGLLVGCGSGGPDPGEAWQVVEIPTKAEIWDLQFLDGQRGYLAGGGFFVEGGLVGRTTDGGLDWEFESGLVPKRRGVMSFSFYALHLLDEQRAFLAGHAGTLMGSEAGWREFRRLRGGPVYGHLRDLHFVDDEFGWAAGETGVLGTEDGGESWEWLGPEGEPRPRIKARAIHFVDREHGHLVGRHGDVKRTRDGGRNWEPCRSTPGGDDAPHLFGLHFADADHGWAVGEGGTIWHTSNGGKRWRSQDSGVEDFLYDVHFIDRQRGWAVGHDRTLRRGVVLGTRNGGGDWEIEVEIAGEELYAIDALPTGEAWAAGKHAGEGGQRLLRRVPPAEE